MPMMIYGGFSVTDACAGCTESVFFLKNQQEGKSGIVPTVSHSSK